MRDLTLGRLSLSLPRVVGTVSSFDTFRSLSAGHGADCDIAEARLDKTDPAEIPRWLEACAELESAGTPVLATLRLPEDGGDWKGTDISRRELLAQALRKLSAIDVEVTSPLRADLCDLAVELNKSLVVSYHNFEGTPTLSELSDLMETMSACPVAIPKFATMVTCFEDLETLNRLLFGSLEKRSVSILGMGPLGLRTRVCFPGLGSKLTYGYLDQPSAPGQLSSARLVSLLEEILPEYAQDRSIRLTPEGRKKCLE